MKFSYRICVLLCCIVGVLSQTTLSPRDEVRKRAEIRRAMRQCIFETKVTYMLAIQYGKGDFQDQSDKGKCFLKCFAVKMKLFDPETGNPDYQELLSYSSYLSSAELNYNEIIEKCDKGTERGEDQCDFVFKVYMCLWDAIKSSPEPESFRQSFQDVFGFNELYDEGEIKAEQEAEEQAKKEVENEENVEEVETQTVEVTE